MWRFGTIVRVDPATNPKVPQPDDRRWMVVSFDDRLKWTLMFVGPAAFDWEHFILVHWNTMYGFCRVEDE